MRKSWREGSRMVNLILFLLLVFSAGACTLEDQRYFLLKQVENPYPIIPNPYVNPTEEYLKEVNRSLYDKEQVCALRYLDQFNRTYRLDTFESKSLLPNDYIITHQGRCAACSTVQDLWVYLTTDLTRTVRKCG